LPHQGDDFIGKGCSVGLSTISSYLESAPRKGYKGQGIVNRIERHYTSDCPWELHVPVVYLNESITTGGLPSPLTPMFSPEFRSERHSELHQQAQHEAG